MPARALAGAAAVAGVAVAVVVAVVALRGPPATPEPLVLPRAVPTTTEGGVFDDAENAVPAGDAPDGTSSESRSSAGAYVHAAGAVAHPGVYRVRAGGRVSDLLDAAGGPAADADLDQVNLAAKVADGERVYVPRRGESPPPIPGSTGVGAGGGAAVGPVNLNTATLEQLDSLPGVGPSTAQAILDYRKTNGRFRSVDELMEVRGIGEAKLAALRSKVRV